MKKKILFSLLAIGILLVLAVIPVFGGTYTGTRTFTIADTSGTSRTNVVALVPITGDSLISAGQINSDGTNTNVDSSSVDVPYTMDTTVMPVFVGDLGAGETKTFNLRTGYAPVQTNFPIIVGDGGILTTPYNPKLELGTYFSVEVNAPINMDAGGTIWSTGGVYVTTGSDTVFAVVNETGGTVNLSLSGVSGASPHDVIFSGNGSLYTLTVDGVSTTATETTGIPYWGYDFVWNNGGAMPYINYIKVSTLQTTATFTIPSATDATVYNDGSYIYIGAGGQILKTSWA